MLRDLVFRISVGFAQALIVLIQQLQGLDKFSDTDQEKIHFTQWDVLISNTAKKQADGFLQIMIVAHRCQSFQFARILVHQFEHGREQLAAQLLFSHG
jgi:hypothetical protein